jgi:hypothetical protein
MGNPTAVSPAWVVEIDSRLLHLRPPSKSWTFAVFGTSSRRGQDLGTPGHRTVVNRISIDVHVPWTSAPGEGGLAPRRTGCCDGSALVGRAAPATTRIALPVAAATTAIADAPSRGPAVRIRATRAGRARASVRAAAVRLVRRRSGRAIDSSRDGATAGGSTGSSWVMVSSRVHAAPSHHVRPPLGPAVCAAPALDRQRSPRRRHRGDTPPRDHRPPGQGRRRPVDVTPRTGEPTRVPVVPDDAHADVDGDVVAAGVTRLASDTDTRSPQPARTGTPGAAARTATEGLRPRRTGPSTLPRCAARPTPCTHRPAARSGA